MVTCAAPPLQYSPPKFWMVAVLPGSDRMWGLGRRDDLESRAGWEEFGVGAWKEWLVRVLRQRVPRFGLDNRTGIGEPARVIGRVRVHGQHVAGGGVGGDHGALLVPERLLRQTLERWLQGRDDGSSLAWTSQNQI